MDITIPKSLLRAGFRHLHETAIIIHGFNGTQDSEHIKYLIDGTCRLVKYSLHFTLHLSITQYYWCIGGQKLNKFCLVYSVCTSWIQRDCSGLGKSVSVSMLSVILVQYKAGGTMHRSVVLVPNIYGHESERHCMCGPFTGCPHLRYGIESSDQEAI